MICYIIIIIITVRSDSEDLSPGEFSPRAPVHSTAKKGSAGVRAPKEPGGLARAFDLGERQCMSVQVRPILSSENGRRSLSQ